LTCQNFQKNLLWKKNNLWKKIKQFLKYLGILHVLKWKYKILIIIQQRPYGPGIHDSTMEKR
jgi:hypothetical protein